MPGTATELELLGFAKAGDVEAIDRRQGDRAVSLGDQFDLLAKRVVAVSGNSPVRIVGFSIGAYIALEVAARLPKTEVSIDLVSAAAPIGLGSPVETMAGAPIFRLAQSSQTALAIAASAQGLVTCVAPGLLAHALFRSSRGADAALRIDARFMEGMKQILRRAFDDGGLQYRREISAYVRDWSPLLAQVRHPVMLWQGTEDNWAPPAMAEALAAMMPNVRGLKLLPGLSHYSTLAAFWKAAAV